MKDSKISFKVILSFLFLLGVLFSSNFPSVSFAENLSDLKVDKYVNDYANIIDDNAERNLESALYNYFASSTNQIVIVTVNNIDGDYIEHYSIKLADKIKAGSEKNDNGVILLVAKDDKQMRIEVGYGLEPTLTDGKSSYIINSILKPNFKNNNYTAGIQQAAQEIINITSDANYKSAGDT